MNSIIVLTLFIGVMLVILAVLLVIFFNLRKTNIKKHKLDDSIKRVIDITEEVESLRIELDCDIIKVLEHNESDIKIELIGEEKRRLLASVENKTLVVSKEKTELVAKPFKVENIVIIYLPRINLDSLKAKLIYGKLTLDNLKADSVSLESVSSKIKGQVTANSFKNEAVKSNLVIDLDAKNIILDSVTSDDFINILSVPDFVKSNSVNGVTRMNLYKDFGFNLTFNSVFGKLSAKDFNISKNTITYQDEKADIKVQSVNSNFVLNKK